MKAILVYMLLAVIFIEVYSAGFELLDSGEIEESEEIEDSDKAEYLPTISLKIPQIGKFLELLRKQENYVEVLFSRMNTKAEQLEKIMKQLADEAIDNIKKMNQSENCKEFGIKLVEIERFNSLFKNQECLVDTVNAVKRPNEQNIMEIYHRVRYYGSNALDIEIEQLTNEIYEYENSTQMTMKNLITGISKDPSNCINRNLRDFNSAISNSTIKVNCCSGDNETSITALTKFYSQLTEAFDLIDHISGYRSKFMTNMRTLVIMEALKMDNKVLEVKEALETLERDTECMQFGVDELFIYRYRYWFNNKECEKESIIRALKSSTEMTASRVQKRIQRSASSFEHEISEIIAKVIDYGNNLPYEDSVVSPLSEEMLRNINKLQMFANTWKKGPGKLSTNCFNKNWKKFEMMSYAIFVEVAKCPRRVSRKK